MRSMVPGVVLGLALAAVAAAQNIVVQSPNGGEQWEVGSTQTIAWVLTGPTKSAAIDIVLIKGSAEVGFVAQNVPVSPTSRSWTVGQLVGGIAGPGVDYRVGIRESGSTETDTSNETFRIVALPAPPPPVTLKLNAPNGGQEWKARSAHTISWSSVNLPGKVKLELVRESDQHSWTIATNLAANGSHPWDAGDFQGGNSGRGSYRVRVRSQATPTRYDDSDQPFTITPSLVAGSVPPHVLNPATMVPAVVQNWMGKDAWPEQYTIPTEPFQGRPSCRPQGAGANQYAVVGRDWFAWQNIQLGGLHRSQVRFDVSPYRSQAGQLTSAKLHLKQVGVVRVNTNHASGALRACELKAPWASFDGIQLGACYNLLPAQTDYRVDVTATVRKWLDGSLPNHGLLLFGAELPSSTLWTCVSCFEATFELKLQ